MMPSWLARMSQRERLLALLVFVVIFGLTNLFFWSWIFGAARDLRAKVAQRKLTRLEQTVYLRDSDLWAKRSQWLKEHQPAFQSAADASGLLDQIKQAATKNNIVLENPTIGTGDAGSAYQSVFATVETKSSWPSLVHFLYDVQTPEAFLAFENAEIRVDTSDPAQMHGRFKIARWSKPAGPPGK